MGLPSKMAAGPAWLSGVCCVFSVWNRRHDHVVDAAEVASGWVTIGGIEVGAPHGHAERPFARGGVFACGAGFGVAHTAAEKIHRGYFKLP